MHKLADLMKFLFLKKWEKYSIQRAGLSHRPHPFPHTPDLGWISCRSKTAKTRLMSTAAHTLIPGLILHRKGDSRFTRAYTRVVGLLQWVNSAFIHQLKEFQNPGKIKSEDQTWLVCFLNTIEGFLSTRKDCGVQIIGLLQDHQKGQHHFNPSVH